MKPIAIVNATLTPDGFPTGWKQLEAEGYIVVLATSGPAVSVVHGEQPSRREVIATECLAGVLARPNGGFVGAAAFAVSQADELIKELDK
jgi:hypothetical protein